MDEDLPAVAALVRRKDDREVFLRIADYARARGLKLAGMIQKEVPHPGRTAPDRILVDAAGGTPIDITEERGDGAVACHLDVQRLEEAVGRLVSGLGTDDEPDLMIVSKFGEVEVSGHGFRQAIERAVEHGVPVLVGVAEPHLAGFKAFADGFEKIYDGEAEVKAFVDRLAGAA